MVHIQFWKKISTSGYKIQHDISKNIIEAPRQWLQTFVTREGGGVDEPVDTDLVSSSKQEDSDDEQEELEEERIEQEVDSEKTVENKKLNRELKNLQSYNKVPSNNNLTKIDVGHMVLVEQADKSIGIAEIIEEREEDWIIHWYGTNSNKTLPRERWKFFPMWEDKNSGEVSVTKSHESFRNPLHTELRKDQVFLHFPKLNLNSTIPIMVLDKIKKYRLS